jgi:hypothetical protein
VGLLDDSLRILDEGGSEENMGDGDEKSLVIDGVEEPLLIHRDGIVAGNKLQPGATPALLIQNIDDGREIHLGGHDLVAALAIIEA